MCSEMWLPNVRCQLFCQALTKKSAKAVYLRYSKIFCQNYCESEKAKSIKMPFH